MGPQIAKDIESARLFVATADMKSPSGLNTHTAIQAS